MPPVKTTLVGSFPLELSKQAIDRVLEDQAEAGVDYPVLPQLRSFIDVYAEPLASAGVLAKTDSGYAYAGPAKRAVEPPWDVVYAADRAREMGVEYRLAITGPLTLAFSAAAPGGRPRSVYGSVLGKPQLFSEFLEDYCEMVSAVVRAARPSVVCLDEPVLALVVGARRVAAGYTPQDLGKALDRALSAAQAGMRGVHVCARLPPLLKEVLLSLKYACFLDHECFDTPANRRYYEPAELAASGKKLAFGVISSKSTRVESVDEVYSLAREALAAYGDALLFVKPDCGFGGLRGVEGAYERVVLPKVRVLVEAARRLNAEAPG